MLYPPSSLLPIIIFAENSLVEPACYLRIAIFLSQCLALTKHSQKRHHAASAGCPRGSARGSSCTKQTTAASPGALLTPSCYRWHCRRYTLSTTMTRHHEKALENTFPRFCANVSFIVNRQSGLLVRRHRVPLPRTNIRMTRINHASTHVSLVLW